MVHSRHGANGALCRKGLVGNLHHQGEALVGQLALAGRETSTGQVKVNWDGE